MIWNTKDFKFSINDSFYICNFLCCFEVILNINYNNLPGCKKNNNLQWNINNICKSKVNIAKYIILYE